MTVARTEAVADASFRSRRKGTAVALVIVVLLGVVGWAALKVSGGGMLGQDPFGRAAPVFELPRVQGGGSISLADLRGSPVVLNFWASWCETCRDEASILAQAERRWRDRGVVFLGIDTSDPTADAIAFQRMYGMGYPSVADPRGGLQAAYGVFGLPETFFIDRAGVIEAKYVGVIDRATLEANIASLATR
jgi:cytochrome c biogenesis protein CcmG, thiol:disulfide interchange protein DsbE